MKSRHYVLTVPAALSAFNQPGRQLVAILLEPIRREFSLSDACILRNTPASAELAMSQSGKFGDWQSLASSLPELEQSVHHRP